MISDMLEKRSLQCLQFASFCAHDVRACVRSIRSIEQHVIRLIIVRSIRSIRSMNGRVTPTAQISNPATPPNTKHTQDRALLFRAMARAFFTPGPQVFTEFIKVLSTIRMEESRAHRGKGTHTDSTD
jgi:hypothetical protein